MASFFDDGYPWSWQDSVMVYMGAPNAQKYAPSPNSFIFANEFADPQHLVTTHPFSCFCVSINDDSIMVCTLGQAKFLQDLSKDEAR